MYVAVFRHHHGSFILYEYREESIMKNHESSIYSNNITTRSREKPEHEKQKGRNRNVKKTKRLREAIDNNIYMNRKRPLLEKKMTGNYIY